MILVLRQNKQSCLVHVTRPAINHSDTLTESELLRSTTRPIGSPVFKTAGLEWMKLLTKYDI